MLSTHFNSQQNFSDHPFVAEYISPDWESKAKRLENFALYTEQVSLRANIPVSLNTKPGLFPLREAKF